MEKGLVQFFIDGTEVQFDIMCRLGLITQSSGGYILTAYGKSFMHRDKHTPDLMDAVATLAGG